VEWGYRLFLDREPGDGDDVDAKRQVFGTTQELRTAFLSAPEYAGKNPGGASFVPQAGVVIAEMEGGLRLFVDLADRAIGLNVVAGTYEPEEVAFARTQIRAGDSVVDVGANIGYFTVLMANWVGRAGSVVALEPIPSNLRLLERSVNENGFAGRVRVIRAAAADARGTAQILSVDTRYGFNSGGACFWPAEIPVPEHHSLIETNRVRIDDLSIPRPVAFVKMDIEGAEGLAIRGARELLGTDRPVVLMEMNPEQLKRVSELSPAALIGEMEGLGFVCRRLADGLPGERVRDLDALCNVVFIHTEGRRWATSEGPKEARGARLPDLLDELGRAENDALKRLERRCRSMENGPERPIESVVPLSSFRELEHQLAQFVRFHDAVRASLAWKLTQRIRRLFGREW